MFIGSVRTEKESAVAEGADLTSDLLPLGEKVGTLYFYILSIKFENKKNDN